MDLYNKNITDLKKDLDLYINLESIDDIELKNKLILELKNSIVPEWMIQKSICNKISKNDNLIINNYKFNITQTNEHNSNMDINNLDDLDNPDDFYNYILEGIENSNKINEFDGEIIFDKEKIKVLKKLNDFGIIFDMRFNKNHQIKINSNEIIFPMCCVGKNRSQYLFYYLKNIQGLSDVNFEVGYPSSGDELSVMIDYLDGYKINGITNTNTNKNVLSSFFPQYKKDNFSNIVTNSLNIINPDGNPDGLNPIARSIHVFDKILKIKQDYLINELKNFETHKYKENKYDIFNCENTKVKIKILFEKYFLLPDSLIKIINYNQYNSKKINRITFICLSDKAFYNLCLCFNSLTQKYETIQLNNIRIVYFGIGDIFQKSNIKQDVISNFKQKFDYGLCF